MPKGSSHWPKTGSGLTLKPGLVKVWSGGLILSECVFRVTYGLMKDEESETRSRSM